VLADHGVLASCGSVGDAYDNALAESFVDTIKTELIRDRVWRTQSQLELAIVAYIGWYNHDRLHEALGDLPPPEYEALALAETLRNRPPEPPRPTKPSLRGTQYGSIRRYIHWRNAHAHDSIARVLGLRRFALIVIVLGALGLLPASVSPVPCLL
jgi:Integrase core domain